jgi:HAE1 family hydrophobic/amphiphilic exporter-1
VRSSSVRGLSRWAVDHETWIWLLFGLLVAVGVASYFQLPVKRFPTVQLPAVAVTVSDGEAAPAELERQVAMPVESTVRTLPGIHRIWTQIAGGQSVTVAQFDSGSSRQALAERVQSVISKLGLEEGGRTVSVRRLEIESTPMLAYAITSAMGSTPLLSAYVDEMVLPRLRKLPGIASARRLGGSQQHLEILLQPDAMRRYGVTPHAVSRSIEGWRSAKGAATSQALSDLGVAAAGGKLVRLRQIATVEEAADVSSHALLDDEAAVGFTLSKSPGADSLKVDKAVAGVASELEEGRPDLSFTKLWSTADETAAALGSTTRALIEGMLLAALVVFLFLRDWRATLVVALAMPVSLVPTFAILVAAGFSLNLVSLLGLTLAVGILVDDAIVEVENIQRLVRAGASPAQAAPAGADSIAPAVVATTAAIVAVFAPVSFMPGVAGRFFFEFGLTVSVAVIMSLLVARLLTPILAVRLLKADTRAEPRSRQLVYRKLLDWALRKPRLTIAGAVAVIAGSVALVPLLPTEFQPNADPDFYFVSVVADRGGRIEDLDALATKARAIVARRPETRHVLVHLGAMAEGGGAAGISLGAPPADPRSARLTVVVDSKRDLSLSEIRHALRPSFQRLGGGTVFAEPPSGAADLQILLSANDPTALARTRVSLLREMKEIPSVVDARPLLQGLAQAPATAKATATGGLMPGEHEAAIALATVGEYRGEAATEEGNMLPVHVRIATSGLVGEAARRADAKRGWPPRLARSRVAVSGRVACRDPAAGRATHRRDRRRPRPRRRQRRSHGRDRAAAGDPGFAERRLARADGRSGGDGDPVRLDGRSFGRSRDRRLHDPGNPLPKPRDAADHRFGPATGAWRGRRRAARHRLCTEPAGADRLSAPARARGEKLDPARRACGAPSARGHADPRQHRRSVRAAITGRGHDERGHGRRHASRCPYIGRRRRIQAADGLRRHRRPDQFDRALSAVRTRAVRSSSVRPAAPNLEALGLHERGDERAHRFVERGQGKPARPRQVAIVEGGIFHDRATAPVGLEFPCAGRPVELHTRLARHQYRERHRGPVQPLGARARLIVGDDRRRQDAPVVEMLRRWPRAIRGRRGHRDSASPLPRESSG